MSSSSKIVYLKRFWPLNYWAKYYEEPSLYSQRMKRLSCKIFNEYYEKPMPRDLARSADHEAKRSFMSKLIQDYNLIARVSTTPIDLDDNRNDKYYPAHPQIRSLTFKLREYGLFRYVTKLRIQSFLFLYSDLFFLSSRVAAHRDEHLDFKEEMQRLNVLRGKKVRSIGGSGGKRAKK
jgi:hypothetical protein